MALNRYVCSICSYKDKPLIYQQGTRRMEIILWLCGILPGLLYTIWRWKTSIMVCPNCEVASMISTKSSHGSRLAGY